MLISLLPIKPLVVSYEMLTEEMKTKISGKSANLIEDGWSNIHNEPIIPSCLQVRGIAII